MRYKLYGHQAQTFDDNTGLDPSAQTDIQYEQVYETDDREEARKIVRNNGFIVNDNFVPVLWAEDTETQGIMGDKPHTSEAYKSTQSKAMNKKDYI